MADNPIRIVESYVVEVEAQVDAEIQGTIAFTSADVREWAGLDESAELDNDTIEEYALEHADEADLEMKDITYWKRSKAAITHREQRQEVPACFVPLFEVEDA